MWEKIVLNLLSNAFKFTFSGEIRVSLRWEDGEDKLLTSLSSSPSLPSPYIVVLEVQDTGIGISASEIPRLFERFHRVKGAQGRTFEGSGIGLSLCEELVKLHGGTVQVSSVEGEGSCFRVLIPTGCAHLPADRIGATSTITSTAMGASPYVEEALQWLTQEEGGTRRGGDKGSVAEEFSLSPCPLVPKSSSSARILLVDDNADMRNYVKRLLSERWQVETAANGALALNLIQQQLPDLVLTDVMMPELDGFQLLNVLRADPVTKSIPVILLSARAGEEATISGLAAGADDYLIKPFSARELIARVKTQLQMSRLRQEQSANRFKNEFLMTVTHELQAPLVAILGWSRLLQTKSFDKTTITHALTTIERNATIEAKLVKDLLDVSSILSGKLRLKCQLVDLVSLVQNVVTSFRQAAQAKKIQLVETISNVALGNVLADGDRLRQIIANLLDNAIKFTPSGGQVDIRLEHLGSVAQITVTDTGIGIAPDFLFQVFDRFSQAEVPSSHSPGGVGIGLAIAHHLVQLHKGTIEVASEGVGRGATFTVKLPLVASVELNDNAQEGEP
jgi:signal transduction histidine kinase